MPIKLRNKYKLLIDEIYNSVMQNLTKNVGKRNQNCKNENAVTWKVEWHQVLAAPCMLLTFLKQKAKHINIK